MPSRRAILAGGAGLVGGAALTGQASAQSAAGQVGTSSEPVDVEAATVTADSVNTEEASIATAPTTNDDAARLQEVEESGAVQMTDGISLTGASDDGWDTEDNATTPASFSTAFADVPNVTTSISRTNSDAPFAGRVEENNVSATGTDITFRQYGTRDHAANNETIAAFWDASKGR
jgi:hypothetical protein